MNNKRKRQTNNEGGSSVVPEDQIVLEDMDLDANIGDIEFPDEEQKIKERKQVATELARQESIQFEEESLTLHSALLDKNSKKMIIEKIHVKNKNVQGKLSSKLDLNEFHRIKLYIYMKPRVNP
jgi:hypothetical protein